MFKNFLICPHCAAKGKSRSVQPATAHRNPLVSRSDGDTFHIFLEENYIQHSARQGDWEVVALFRWDLDSLGVKGESTLVLLPVTSGEATAGVRDLETAADDLSAMLRQGLSLPRQGFLSSRKTA